MLWNESAIMGYPIKATDGRIVTMSDHMFEDVDWAIRWLVVDTGGWLPGRRVLLPVSALRQPDPEAHQLPVDLTMRQIDESPDIDTSQPVSQQSEARISEHYDLAHARDSFIRGEHDAVSAGVTAIDEQQIPPMANMASRNANTERRDSRLRRISEIIGNGIEATDGDIGHAEDFLIDTAPWQVRYVTVHTANWWPGEKVLISPRSVDWIDWARRIIHLNVTRQKVKDSPPYVAAETVDGAFEALFHTNYGIGVARR